jgi:hypothetical protein
MIRLFAFAAFAFAVTTSVQATPVAPIQDPESMITQVVAGCGVGSLNRHTMSAAGHTGSPSSFGSGGLYRLHVFACA